MTASPCAYANRSPEAYRAPIDGGPMTRTEGPMLCTWADDAAPPQLLSVPRWLQSNALAGHLLRYPDDCLGCPCFKARPAP